MHTKLFILAVCCFMQVQSFIGRCQRTSLWPWLWNDQSSPHVPCYERQLSRLM